MAKKKKIRAQNVHAQNISLSDNYLGSYPEDARGHARGSLCMLSCTTKTKTATDPKSSRKPTNNKTDKNPLHYIFTNVMKMKGSFLQRFFSNLTF
jgi:hypothetical protein